MPYKSEAQRRKFHAMEARGEISSATVKEFDKASKGRKLPEAKGDRTMAKDGMLKGMTEKSSSLIGEDGKHSEHGADGSHQNTHKGIGGARSRIHTGHPDEMVESDGRKE